MPARSIVVTFYGCLPIVPLGFRTHAPPATLRHKMINANAKRRARIKRDNHAWSWFSSQQLRNCAFCEDNDGAQARQPFLPPEKRSLFLGEACGDGAEMRTAVEALIPADEISDPFMEPPWHDGAELSVSLLDTHKRADGNGRVSS